MSAVHPTDDAEALGFRALMFSDCARYDPSRPASWLRILLLLPAHPGLICSFVVRAQQALLRGGHVWLAWGLRGVGNVLVGADIVPGAQVGPGVAFHHPSGVVLGPGSKIGSNATLASGVVLGVSRREEDVDQSRPVPFPQVGDNVFLGAHAVLLGDIRVGDWATVGAGAVVTTDVPPATVVAGNPARPVTPGDGTADGDPERAVSG